MATAVAATTVCERPRLQFNSPVRPVQYVCDLNVEVVKYGVEFLAFGRHNTVISRADPVCVGTCIVTCQTTMDNDRVPVDVMTVCISTTIAQFDSHIGNTFAVLDQVPE